MKIKRALLIVTAIIMLAGFSGKVSGVSASKIMTNNHMEIQYRAGSDLLNPYIEERGEDPEIPEDEEITFVVSVSIVDNNL